MPAPELLLEAVFEPQAPVRKPVLLWVVLPVEALLPEEIAALADYYASLPARPAE